MSINHVNAKAPHRKLDLPIIAGMLGMGVIVAVAGAVRDHWKTQPAHVLQRVEALQEQANRVIESENQSDATTLEELKTIHRKVDYILQEVRE